MSNRCPSVSLYVPLSGVVSVSFEEDEEGNFCLIAYPLQSDPAADLENKDPSADCESKSEMLKCGKMIASSLLVDGENYSNDGRFRHSRKDKDKRWDERKCPNRDSSTLRNLVTDDKVEGVVDASTGGGKVSHFHTYIEACVNEIEDDALIRTVTQPWYI